MTEPEQPEQFDFDPATEAAIFATQAHHAARRARAFALLAGVLFLFQLVFVGVVLYTAP